MDDKDDVNEPERSVGCKQGVAVCNSTPSPIRVAMMRNKKQTLLSLFLIGADDRT